MDDYAKIRRRTAAMKPFAFYDPPLERKVMLLTRMEKTLAAHGMELLTCCEKEVLTRLPADSTVRPSACIPGDLLESLHGPGLDVRRDPGQRRSQGCGCSRSVDIGSYSLHPCYHNCLFCYANPSPPPDRQGASRYVANPNKMKLPRRHQAIKTPPEGRKRQKSLP
jgi:hypothetical protein